MAVYISNKAKKYANKTVLLIENEEYMNSLYEKSRINVINSIKNKMNKIYKEMDSLQYTLIERCTIFYYKLNTSRNKQGHLIITSDLLIEGEIGYTCNSIHRRHPNANIQFIQHINDEGSSIKKGGKITVEKAVIENINHLSYIKFGNSNKPKSKEIFRFPYTKIQEVREKIENTVIRYKFHGDIFKQNFK